MVNTLVAAPHLRTPHHHSPTAAHRSLPAPVRIHLRTSLGIPLRSHLRLLVHLDLHCNTLDPIAMQVQQHAPPRPHDGAASQTQMLVVCPSSMVECSFPSLGSQSHLLYPTARAKMPQLVNQLRTGIS